SDPFTIVFELRGECRTGAQTLCIMRRFIPRLPNSRQIRLARWPVGPVSCSLSEVRTHDMTAKPSRLPIGRILLAEDDESMRGFLEKALTRAGYDVIAFANGADAFERLKEEPF